MGYLVLDGAVFAITKDDVDGLGNPGAAQTEWVDVIGNRTSGPFVGSPVWTADGLVANGNDYFTFASDSGLKFGTGPFSMGGWWKTGSDTTGVQMLCWKGAAGTGGAYSVYQYNNGFTSYVLQYENASQGIVQRVTSGNTANTWHHVYLVYPGAGNYVKLYLDGSPVGYSIYSPGTWNTDDNGALYFLSQLGGGGFASGVLDSWAIYNRALSDGEVARNMAAGRGAVPGVYTGEEPYEDGDYTIQKFLFTGEFATPSGVTEVDATLVAGGGGGGARHGGGGGGGGMLDRTGLAVSGTMTVVVGAEGAGAKGGGYTGSPPDEDTATAGGDTTFASETAVGGGPGRGYVSGIAGGSGGGGGAGGTGGSPTSGQGHAGGAGYGGGGGDYSGGGGGGAGGAGGNASSGNVVGTGGTGAVSAITGDTYADGGMGGNYGSSTVGVAGTPNTGNGGSAAGGETNPGGKGGSGIAVIRWLTVGPASDMVGTGVIALGGFADLNALHTKGIGVIALGGSADLSTDSELRGTSIISLAGYAYLSGIPRGYDTMKGTGILRLGGSARLSSDYDPPLPETDDLGWTEEDVTPLPIDLVKILGLPIPRGNITTFDIELDDQGGPQSASVTVDSDLVKAPAMLSIMRVTYQPPGLDEPAKLFYGRLDSIAANVDSGTGYTLTYGPAMETLHDHKAHRQVYVTSDLSEWQTGQGPRTAPDVFAT